MKKRYILVSAIIIFVVVYFASSYTPKEIDTGYIDNSLQSHNLNWKVRDEEKVNEYIRAFAIQVEGIAEDAILLPYINVSVNKDIRRVHFTVGHMRDYRVDKEDIPKVFAVLAKVYGGFRDDSAVYKTFEKDIKNGNYITRAEGTNYHQWYGKFGNTHCIVGFGINSDSSSQPFNIFDITYMSDASFNSGDLPEIFQSK